MTLLLTLLGCSFFAPAPPVVVEARWEGQPSDNPRFLSVEIHTNQDVCLFDQHVVRIQDQGKDVYRISDRVSQSDFHIADHDTWDDTEPGLLLRLAITMYPGNLLVPSDHLFPAVRCVPAGTDIHREIRVPTPVAFWHPVGSDGAKAYPLPTHPKFAVVMVGYTVGPLQHETVDTLLADGTVIQRVSPEYWDGPDLQSIATSQPLSMEGMEYL